MNGGRRRGGEGNETETAPATVNRRGKMFEEKYESGQTGGALGPPWRFFSQEKKGRVLTILEFHYTESLWSL